MSKGVIGFTPAKGAEGGIMMFHSRSSVQQILEAGGFGDYKVRVARAKDMSHAGHSPIGGADRNGLILVGRVAAIQDVPEGRSEGRSEGRRFIRCDRFAQVDLKNVWPEKNQFPVAYLSWEEIFGEGSTPEQLQWKTREEMMVELGVTVAPVMVAAPATAAEDIDGRHRLSLATAKAIIAAHLQTTPDAITIEI